MENMNLISEYEKAQTQVNSLLKKEHELEKHYDKESHEVKYLYWDKIYELERERDQKIHKLMDTLNTEKEHIRVELIPHNETVSKVQRILKMMTLNAELHKPEVYYYSNRDANGNYISNKRKVILTPIKTIFWDDYNIISLYIVPNGNSVNQYSLVIRGYTPFSEFLNHLSYGYVHTVNENYSPIRIIIKTAEDEQTLRDYIDRPRNMKRIMEMIQEDNLLKLSEEYKKAMELYQQKEWKILHLKERKYYYENHYSHGTETDEYKEVLSKLRELEN